MTTKPAISKATAARRKGLRRRWLFGAVAAGLLLLGLTAEHWMAALVEFEAGRRLSGVLRLGRLKFFTQGRIAVDDLSLGARYGGEPGLGWKTGSLRYDSIGALCRGRLTEISITQPWIDLDRLGWMQVSASARRGPRLQPTLQDLFSRAPGRLTVDAGRLQKGEATLWIESFQARTREIPSSATLISISARLRSEDSALAGALSIPMTFEAEGRVLANSFQVRQARVAVAGLETLNGAAEMDNWRSLPTLQGRVRTRDFSTTDVVRRMAPEWLGRIGGVFHDGQCVWLGRPGFHRGELPFELSSRLRLRGGYWRSPDGQIGIEGVNQDLVLTAQLDRDLLTQDLDLKAAGSVGAVRFPARNFPGLDTNLGLKIEPGAIARRRLTADFNLNAANAGPPVRGKGAFQLATRGRAIYDIPRGLLQANVEECRLTVRPERGPSALAAASGSFDLNCADFDDPANLFQAQFSGLGKKLTVRGTLPMGPSRFWEAEASEIELDKVFGLLNALGLPSPFGAVGQLSGRAMARQVPGEETTVDFSGRMARFHPAAPPGRRWGSVDLEVAGRARVSGPEARLVVESLSFDGGPAVQASLSGEAALSSPKKTASFTARGAISRLDQFSAFLGGLGFDLRGSSEFQGHIEARAEPAGIQIQGQGTLDLRDVASRMGAGRLVLAKAAAKIPATMVWSVDHSNGRQRWDFLFDKVQGSVGYLRAGGLSLTDASMSLQPGKISLLVPPSSGRAAVEFAGLHAAFGQNLNLDLSGRVELGGERVSPRLQTAFKTPDLGTLLTSAEGPVQFRPGGRASGDAAIEPLAAGGIHAALGLTIEGLEAALAGGVAVARGISTPGGRRVAMDVGQEGARFHASGLRLACDSLIAGGAEARALDARLDVRLDAEATTLTWTLERVSLLGGVASGKGQLTVDPRTAAWTATAKLQFQGIDLARVTETYQPSGTRLSGPIDGDLEALIRDGRMETVVAHATGAQPPVSINRERVLWLATLGQIQGSSADVERVLSRSFKKAGMIPFPTATIEGHYVPPDAAAPEDSDEFRLALLLDNQALKLTVPIQLDRPAVAFYLMLRQNLARMGNRPD